MQDPELHICWTYLQMLMLWDAAWLLEHMHQCIEKWVLHHHQRIDVLSR